VETPASDPTTAPPNPEGQGQGGQGGGGGEKATMSGHRREGVHTGLHRESKEHHAAGHQAKETPKGEYQHAHRVHTSAERNAALARKHAQELLDEAARDLHNNEAFNQNQITTDFKEEHKIQGLNFDEERKKRGRRQNQDDDQDQAHEETPEEAAAKALGKKEGGGKYFQDMPEDRMGDVSLTNPDEMKRMLGPSVRFAQHAMLLAEARMKEGMPREEALQFLASLYLGVSDRDYARKALREFGPATGIMDLYPLELMKHLLEHVPSFITKISTAKFLVAQPKEAHKSETGQPIVLNYDAELRIRGFAIKGGGTPGYVFEPVDPPGTYHLTFATPGTFTVLLSALTKTGALMIEELEIEIVKGKDSLNFENNEAMKKAHDAVEELGAQAEPGQAAASTAPGATPGEGGAEASPGTAPPASAEPKKKKKNQDLKFTIPRKI
jgi:hypothetical protein